MKPERPMILPDAMVGILGGGQLGRMMALSARRMGYRIACLDPGKNSSCGQIADLEILASFDDLKGAERLGEAADVITYEFENISPGVTDLLEKKAYLPQGSKALRVSRHRCMEKRALEAAGVSVAPWRPVSSETTFQEALNELGTPAILKTAQGGYDGKGQVLIGEKREALPAFHALQDRGELVLESFVDFTKELSLIVVRGSKGEVITFPVVENIHVNGILHLTMAPASVRPEVAEKAREVATEIAAEFDLLGAMGVEFFLTSSGELLVNEVAPRPHNSGHYSLDGCWNSQFDTHIEAICGLKLGNPRLHTPVVMVNLLGEHLEGVGQLISSRLPGNLELKLHLYGKKGARKGRKMGHINLLCDDLHSALAWVESSPIWQKEPK